LAAEDVILWVGQLFIDEGIELTPRAQFNFLHAIQYRRRRRFVPLCHCSSESPSTLGVVAILAGFAAFSRGLDGII
jgi:hypothetical protein